MPLTGVDFDRIIDLKSDNAYSGYFDTTKKNRLIREATNKAIDWRVSNNDNIRPQSDLFGIYKSNVTFTPTSNTLSLIAAGSGITDYFYMMNIRCLFVIPISGNYITSASNSSPITITLYKDSNLATGERVVIAGVTGNTNANGTRYVRMINRNKAMLYADENLLTPIAGNGAYTGSSGSISRVVNRYAKDYASGRKFSDLNRPDYNNPFYEIADGSVKIYPLNWVCSSIDVDYISQPTYIDCTDSGTDLLQIYSDRFIDTIADFTVKLMGESSRDDGEIMNANAEIIQAK